MNLKEEIVKELEDAEASLLIYRANFARLHTDLHQLTERDVTYMTFRQLKKHAWKIRQTYTSLSNVTKDVEAVQAAVNRYKELLLV